MEHKPHRGRPPVTEIRRQRSIRATDAEWAAFIALGGTRWLRDQVQLALAVKALPTTGDPPP
jgi:hypothetical protein